MRIAIVTPAPPRSRYGNRVTALRWARILRSAGHRVSIDQSYSDEPTDLLIALHARRSFDSISRAHRAHPKLPIIVALTGTDLYRDLPRSSRAKESLQLATRIVALQPKALDELPGQLRKKARVIYQSVGMAQGARKHKPNEVASGPISGSVESRARRLSPEQSRAFDVCVIGHLRPVKDPFRTALAARKLPASSRIRVIHVGGAMSEEATARAHEEMRKNPRYRWLGEQPRWRVRQVLRRSRLFVLTSRLEGGANALGEAIVAGVPVLSSRIPGSIGILGERYPGYFGVGDTTELARLMSRAETDPTFLSGLETHCRRLASLFEPSKEQAAWVRLLEELF